MAKLAVLLCYAGSHALGLFSSLKSSSRCAGLLDFGSFQSSFGGHNFVASHIHVVMSKFLESLLLFIGSFLLCFLGSGNLLSLSDLLVDRHYSFVLNFSGFKFVMGLNFIGNLDLALLLVSLFIVFMASSSNLGISLGIGSSSFSISLGNSLSGVDISGVHVGLSSVLLLNGNLLGLNLLLSGDFLGLKLLLLELLDGLRSLVVVASAYAAAALVWVLLIQFPDVEVLDTFEVIKIWGCILHLASAFVWTVAGVATSFAVKVATKVCLQPVESLLRLHDVLLVSWRTTDLGGLNYAQKCSNH